MSSSIERDPKIELLQAQFLVQELRTQGALPAMTETVQDLCRIAGSESSTSADLTKVIMRDQGLTTAILTVINSALYGLKYPVITISSAVRLLGFNNVKNLALSLSLFHKRFQGELQREIADLYAHSYVAGSLAMALGHEGKMKYPEQLFMAGMFRQLPMITLKTCMPEKFSLMQNLIEEGKSFDSAFFQAFSTSFELYSQQMISSYHISGPAANMIRQRMLPPTDRLGELVCQADHLAGLVSQAETCETQKLSFSEIQEKLKKLIGPKFDCQSFFEKTLSQDPNLQRLFKIGAEDLETMVECIGSGGKPERTLSDHMLGRRSEKMQKAKEKAKIQSKEKTQKAIKKDKKSVQEEILLESSYASDQVDPVQLMGQFLTEFMMAKRKKVPLSEMLLIAQEALYRCVLGADVCLMLLNRDHSRYCGRFFNSHTNSLVAEDFDINCLQKKSLLIKAALVKQPVCANNIETDVLLLPSKVQRKRKYRNVAISPLLVDDKCIGLYLLARQQDHPLSEQEEIWLEQFADMVAGVIRDSRR